MSGKRSFDADKSDPDAKKLKMEKGDDFPYGNRITILQSLGKTVCHVPTDELQKVMRLGSARRKLEFEEASIQVYDFHLDRSVVKFLAHWIYHRNSREAVKAAFGEHTEAEDGVLDEKWLAHLIRAINSIESLTGFTCDIIDSLVDGFLAFLERCGLPHIDRVYEICRNTSGTQILTSVFASVFIHRKKQFAQHDPTCDYDRAVQKHMQEWLADVLVNGGDWSRLPPLLGHREFDACLHHRHGKDKACYVHGRIVNTN